MTDLRARVRDGRLVLDEPTDLPEGTVLDLVIDDEGDDLTTEERARLDAAIERAWQQIESGQAIPAQTVLEELRKKHRADLDLPGPLRTTRPVAGQRDR